MPTAAIKFPLQHPPYVVQDRESDRFRVEQNIKRGIVKPARWYRKLHRKLPAVNFGLVQNLILHSWSKWL
jgi:hypothetical protein